MIGLEGSRQLKKPLDMEKEHQTKLTRIIAASVLLVAACVVERNTSLPLWQLLLIYLVPYLVAGYDVLLETAENIVHGEVFDEDFLMGVATLGALAIGFLPGAEHQFPEAVFVMLFFQVGELFEHVAEGRSRRSISALMDIRPDTARVLRNGAALVVDPRTVEVGETIIIQPGERIALDGVVIEGHSSLDTVALTGESVPRSVKEGENVISGCVNLTGLLKVRATKVFGESTASKILDLVEHASASKSESEHFISRFARVYTPTVVVLALVLALVPPLVTGDWVTWIYRGLIFLVVSCPCALVVSIPLTFFSGIGGASKSGILVKGSNYLEALAHVDVAVFDKTGTLTKGVFEVTAVHPDNINETELLHLAAHVERHSNHPIAVSLRDAYPDESDNCSVENVEEVTGQGVKAVVNGRAVVVGNDRMMNAVGVAMTECAECQHLAGTVVHVAIEGEYAGHIVISDRMKDDSKEAIAALRQAGVRRVVMLTGDHERVGAAVAAQLGLDEYHAELLPADKVTRVEQLLQATAPGKKLAFVGDGINDAPVLARSDVGIAMGALGSDAAIEAADVVLMDDHPAKIAVGIKIGKKTLRIARENVVFSIGVKVGILVLAAVGVAGMTLAVFGDVGVLVLAVLNATRALKTEKKP